MKKPDNLQEKHSLRTYCTFQIGGEADFFIEVGNENELVQALDWAKSEGLAVFVFGAGSNLLFDSDGFRGLMIRIKAGANAFKVNREENDLIAFAGLPSALVVQTALTEGLTGLEAWNGLPGSIGGAVFGNAGCFGLETTDFLVSANVWTKEDGCQTVEPDYFSYSYRHSGLREKLVSEEGTVLQSSLNAAVVLSARFHLEKGDKEDILSEMKEIAQLRKGKQPPGLNTGSFFKNPRLAEDHPLHGKSAGWMIEQAGLKGYEMKTIKADNPMKVSEHHANFFMNTGGASSKDVLELSGHVIQSVEQWSETEYGTEHKITLKREVIYVPAQIGA